MLEKEAEELRTQLKDSENRTRIESEELIQAQNQILASDLLKSDLEDETRFI